MFYATWLIGFINAGETTKATKIGAGHKQLARHISAAQARQKQGYAKSAYEGAKMGE